MVTINSKDCSVTKVSETQEKEFLNKHDELGYYRSRIAYGLFSSDGELLQVMSFCITEECDKDFAFELKRNCAKKGCSIEDGSKKLFDYFVSHNNVCSCICKLSQDNCIPPGFVKHESSMIYYPFGVVYKMLDKDDGTNYVGMCESKRAWDHGYSGSGFIWKRHIAANKDHEYERIVLYEAKHPSELREKELEFILQSIGTPGNVNVSTTKQGDKGRLISLKEQKVCESCGGRRGHHKKGCKYYKYTSVCELCGTSHGRHLKSCPKYKPPKKCLICGGSYNHERWCSQYNNPSFCQECLGRRGHHYSWCSKYKATEVVCPECGGKNNIHRASCSKHNEIVCPECGKKKGHHAKECSRYKAPKPCPECGSTMGSHKSTCSKAKMCLECGYSLQSRRHAKTCPHYKEPKKAKPCPECGCIKTHTANCSRNKNGGYCPECGYALQSHTHAKTCSRYKEKKKPAICLECGSPVTSHKRICSHYSRGSRSQM